MATTSGGRKRVGRTLRRNRGGTGHSGTGTGSGPSHALQPIEVNTVVDLTRPSTSHHFAHSPAPLKPKAVAVKQERETAAAELPEEEDAKENMGAEGTRASKRKRETATAAAPAVKGEAKAAVATGRRGKKAAPASATTKVSTKGGPKKAKKETDAAAVAAELDRKTQKATQLLQELERQLEKRCADLRAEAERKSEELRMELKVQLMFLPESVRAMPWKTFIEDFGGSLENVIQNVKEQDYINFVTSQRGLAAVASPQSALKIRPVPSTVRSKDRRSNSSTPGGTLATPSASIRGSLSNFQTPLCTPSSAIPSTVIRTARKGEMTYSIRGSPIAPESVTKAPVGSLVATFQDDAGPLTSITLDNEMAVDLTNPEVLSEETRAQARSKLEALQAKVNALLRQFK